MVIKLTVTMLQTGRNYICGWSGLNTRFIRKNISLFYCCNRIFVDTFLFGIDCHAKVMNNTRFKNNTQIHQVNQNLIKIR